MIPCSSISDSLGLRFYRRQFSQEFENLYALEIGCLLTSGIMHDQGHGDIFLKGGF
jgi:hypothetical protein